MIKNIISFLRYNIMTDYLDTAYVLYKRCVRQVVLGKKNELKNKKTKETTRNKKDGVAVGPIY